MSTNPNFINIGERTNVTGSAKFKKLILSNNFDQAIEIAKELGPGHTVVTILCDSGQRYQSKIWNPKFLKSKDLIVPNWL